MQSEDEMEWHQHSPLPLYVKLEFTEPTGEHPLTPRQVREYYFSNATNSGLVIWRNKNMNLFGLRAGIDELTWGLDNVSRIELSWARPAKANGYIDIRVLDHSTGKATLVLAADHYSDRLLAWFKEIAETLKAMFPGRVTEHDEGRDA